MDASGSAADGGPWAGDVYKVTEVLRARRPDLVVLEIDTSPTGTLVVLLPDAHDQRSPQRTTTWYPSWSSPDPQEVPDWALTRSRAIDPASLLQAPIWDELPGGPRTPSRPGEDDPERHVYARAGLLAARSSR